MNISDYLMISKICSLVALFCFIILWGWVIFKTPYISFKYVALFSVLIPANVVIAGVSMIAFKIAQMTDSVVVPPLSIICACGLIGFVIGILYSYALYQAAKDCRARKN